VSQPTVNVIIPCRNEEAHIESCIRSLWNQDYPREKLEVLILDGKSEDRTQQIIRALLPEAPVPTRLVVNARRSIPAALNKGIEEAKGEYIVRMDAHTRYADNYIFECVQHSIRTGAENVGGAIITCPGAETAEAYGVVCGLTSVIGVGNSRFRVGSKDAISVDTIPFGCFRREFLKRIGGYNEAMLRAEDYELNLRIRKSGGKVLLIPSIISHYQARDTILKVYKTYYQYGQYKAAIALKHGFFSLPWRQYVPLIFVLGNLGLAGLSFLCSCFLGIWLTLLALYLGLAAAFLSPAARSSGKPYLAVLENAVLTVAAIHFGNGLGNLAGLFFKAMERVSGQPRGDLSLTR